MIEPKTEIKEEPSDIISEAHNADIDNGDMIPNLADLKTENISEQLPSNEPDNLNEEETRNDEEDEEEEEEDDDDDDDINIIINTAKSGSHATSSAYKISSLQKQSSTDGSITPAISKSGLAPAITIPEESITTTPAVDYSMTVMAEEDKPWKKPGADVTDFFNYGFTEETWVGYCEKQKDLRQKYGTSLSRAVIPNPLAQTNKMKSSKPSMQVIGTINVIGEKVPQSISTVGSAIPTLGQPNLAKPASLTPDIFNQPPPGFMPPGMPFSVPPPGSFLPTGFTPGMPPPFGMMPPNMMMPPGMLPPPGIRPPEPILVPTSIPSSDADNNALKDNASSPFHPEEYSSYTKTNSPDAAKRLNDWDKDSNDGHSSGSESGYRKRSKHRESSRRRDTRKSKRRSNSKTRPSSKHKRKREESRSPDRY